MGKLLRLLLVLLIASVASVGSLVAQNGFEGIAFRENKLKTTVYEVKLVGVSNTIQADQLDESLLTKMGIVAAETNLATHTCLVEVTRDITPALIRDAIEGAGYHVAKSFE